MSRLQAATVALLVLVSGCTDSASPDSSGVPRADPVDLGVIPADAESTFRWRIAVPAGSQWRVENFSSGCPCVTLGPVPQTLRGGETVEVSASIHLGAGASTLVQAVLTLSKKSGSAGHVELPLFVRAQGSGRTPRSVDEVRADVGTVTPGGVALAELAVPGDRDLRAVKLTSATDPRLEVTLDPMDVGQRSPSAPEQHWKATLRTVAPAREGRFFAIAEGSAGDGSVPLRFVLDGRAEYALRVQPAGLYLGRVDTGSEQRLSLRLTAADGAAIRSVSLDPADGDSDLRRGAEEGTWALVLRAPREPRETWSRTFTLLAMTDRGTTIARPLVVAGVVVAPGDRSTTTGADGR